MVNQFSDVWAHYDPYATKFIQHTQFQDLLFQIDPPLGIGVKGTRHDVWHLINSISIPVHDNCRIHYAEVLFALAKRICGAPLPNDTKIYQNIQRQLTKKLPKYDDDQPIHSLHVMLAVVKCQRLWRQKVLKRKLDKIKSMSHQD